MLRWKWRKTLKLGIELAIRDSGKELANHLSVKRWIGGNVVQVESVNYFKMYDNEKKRLKKRST